MKKKVIVAMSGGVDSAVAAAILQKKGYEVIGVTLRLIFKKDSKDIECCGADESLNKAKEVCAKLGIRHYFKNAQRLFKRDIINTFIEEYLNGRTPNPCIECNRTVKFGYLFDFAKQMGADALVTGHYAKILNRDGEFGLYRGRDDKKDQSYFLYCLQRSKLKNLLFPLGNLTKKNVRCMAASFGLSLAKEKESKDICFIPDGDYTGFIKKNGKIRSLKGKIIDEKGKVLGWHNGFFNFTVGQRRGLDIAAKNRLYVSRIVPASNIIVVGDLDNVYFKDFSVKNINWLSFKKFEENDDIKVQVRYRHKPSKCKIIKIGKNFMRLSFAKKQFALTEGQSAVFYSGNKVFGGGIIDEVERGNNRKGIGFPPLRLPSKLRRRAGGGQAG
ncbi:MAG: tRNA 2-thiouridine(34) synthase MnmA [Elusimicrobiota bacterium]|nr:tRNA 2-thiouridine(34) synthase MnmA [Elusimicrobiota bacterium]